MYLWEFPGSSMKSVVTITFFFAGPRRAATRSAVLPTPRGAMQCPGTTENLNFKSRPQHRHSHILIPESCLWNQSKFLKKKKLNQNVNIKQFTSANKQERLPTNMKIRWVKGINHRVFPSLSLFTLKTLGLDNWTAGDVFLTHTQTLITFKYFKRKKTFWRASSPLCFLS